MKQETIIAVIKSKGCFQINPLAYRSEKARKLCKKMVKDGLLERQVVSPSIHNYFLKD